jgi:hypothetical protein
LAADPSPVKVYFSANLHPILTMGNYNMCENLICLLSIRNGSFGKYDCLCIRTCWILGSRQPDLLHS